MFSKKTSTPNNVEEQVMQEVTDEQLSQVTGGSLLGGGLLNTVTGTASGLLSSATPAVGGAVPTVGGLLSTVAPAVSGLVPEVGVGADVTAGPVNVALGAGTNR